jgi:hypothetical protein
VMVKRTSRHIRGLGDVLERAGRVPFRAEDDECRPKQGLSGLCGLFLAAFHGCIQTSMYVKVKWESSSFDLGPSQ